MSPYKLILFQVCGEWHTLEIIVKVKVNQKQIEAAEAQLKIVNTMKTNKQKFPCF